MNGVINFQNTPVCHSEYRAAFIEKPFNFLVTLSFFFRGLKDLLTPILAGILESDPASAMSFEEFFARIQDILSRKV